MDISKLKVKVKNKAPKRLGRGTGSGTGKTAGRGHKGAGQRSGKVLPYPGFNGGNVPHVRKLPKRGFTNTFKIEYQIVNLRDIDAKLKGIDVIDPAVLEEKGLIKDQDQPIKILGAVTSPFAAKVTLKADKFSASVVKSVESAGGKVEVRTKA